jgi:hypothetical protein
MATKPNLFGSQSAVILALTCAPIAIGCGARQASLGNAPATAPAPGAAPPGTVSPGLTVAPAVASARRVDLGPGGRIAVDGTPVAAVAELGQRLGHVAGQTVTVVIGPGAPESAVGELVAELRKAGVGRVDLNFAAEPTVSALPSPASSSAPTTPPGAAAMASALPELAVRTVGLHIGGGPNDDQTKAFFRKPVEERFEDFRRCYSLVAEPGKGGTFGADLAIGREGGKPKISQPRTAMGGAAFQECMLGAFSRISFPKPPRGPTGISYSLRFSIGGK